MSALEGPGEALDEVELELHGVVYTVSVLVHGDELLVIKIEDKDTLDTWHGEFAAKYVEDITSKTGSFKKFSVFVRMLQSAVLQQSDSVFVDLLTCQDLEMLKAKKAAAAGANGDPAVQQPQQQIRQLPASLASKRYLILTYASEFDRVHYPLPLQADGQPDPARFRAVIASLRQQLAEVQAALPAQQQPQGGQQLMLAGARARGRGANRVDADAALLVSRLEVAQAELEGERAAHRREMRKKMREVQELQEELSRSRDVARELRLRITKLETELEAARSSSLAAGVPGKGTYRRPAAADRYSYGGSTSYLAGSSKFPSRPANQYAGSRNSSQGSSPASSRGASPSYTRPWAQNSTPTRPPRPSSAPPKQRFDPTEYVRQKREREQQRLSQRRSSSASRGGSPSPSMRSRGGDQSGASTPRTSLSHASSFDRRSERGLAPGGDTRGSGTGRGGSLGDVRGSSGSSGGGGLYRQPGGSSGGRGGSNGGGCDRQQRPGSSGGGYCSSGGHGGSNGGYDIGRPGSAGRQLQRPGSSSSMQDQLGAVYGVTAARGPGSRPSSRPTSRQRLDRDTASGRDGPGAASPGRALQGVRDKLDAYYAKQQQQQRMQAGVVRTTQASPAFPAKASPRQQLSAAPITAGSPPPKAAVTAGNGVFKEASSEIADIDQRLHALQNFLKMAKSSVSGA